MSEYYDREGKEITIDDWAKKFENGDYKVVRKSTVHGMDISTVWLGSDHGFGMSEKPIIFETMIFGGPWDQFEQRYPSEEQAVLGHHTIERMIEYHYETKFEVEEWVKVK